MACFLFGVVAQKNGAMPRFYQNSYLNFNIPVCEV